jgi:hypothetical protein
MKITLSLEFTENREILVNVETKIFIQTEREYIIISDKCINKIQTLESRLEDFLSRPDYRSTSRLVCSGVLSRSKKFRYLGAVKPHTNNNRRVLRFYGAVIGKSEYVICQKSGFDINYITLPRNFFTEIVGYHISRVRPSDRCSDKLLRK